MSHELTIRANGAVEMAYLAAEGTPWHGLGQALPAGQTIDQWQSAAGMDWRIQRSKVRFATSRDAQGGEHQGMGATLDGVKGTAWGLFNAATEYVDHHVRATSADNRLSSAWFGPGDALKTRALELVTAL